jgi:hypothetical protein
MRRREEHFHPKTALLLSEKGATFSDKKSGQIEWQT